jgi:uncharacterized protein YndB with AHSA1/START domain
MSSVSEINEQAPVVGRSEIEIAAAPDVVWDVLTAIERWPSWNPAIKSATLEGAVETGSKFRWKTGPGTIKSIIAEVEKPSRIAWNGTTFGLKATHVHTFEARDGKTLARSEESFDGLVARLFHKRLQQTIDSALEDGLRHLKAEAERLERAP